ncbi:MAG: DUF4288 domain-containing protein [Verrucomicrobia bacterium]|nr:DUF4288 domain-containing protein [Leptolyngbya sp. ES-bin-22]
MSLKADGTKMAYIPPYIPKDAKWYIAELVMECQIEGESSNVVHIDIVLVRADSPKEAFEKAEQLGREGEDSYLNPNDQRATWIYRGLRDLNVVHDELEHGTELMFEEKIGLSEDEVKALLTSKSQLNIFRLDQPRDPSYPNYISKEIMEEVLDMMRDDDSQHSVEADDLNS